MDRNQLLSQLKSITEAAEALRPQIQSLPQSHASLGQEIERLVSLVNGFAAAFESHASPVSSGEVDAMLTDAIKNILQESEQRYRTLFESIDEGFCIIEVLFDENNTPIDYRFIETNPAFEAQTGLINAVGKRMRELAPEHETHWFETYGRIARTGLPERFVAEARQLGYRWYDVYAFPFGRGYIGVLFNDISERKSIEQERTALLEREQAARREAERAIAIQRQFLGMVSHELRTPLTLIKGFSSTLLATDITFAPRQWREFTELIDQEADKLTELIDQLLDVVGIQTGTLRVIPTVECINTLIETMLPNLRMIASPRELRVSLSPDMPLVYADPLRVRQILINLVDNATKYSPPDTCITLSTNRLDNFIQVNVSDDGEGIPMSEHAAVFDAFHRVQREENNIAGTGLGLAICKGLVEAHGGTIWIEDRSDPGTTVSFTLPVANETPV